MSQLPFHPLANIFPLLEGAELDALVDDIRANGVREPVWLLDGQILDGRNRYRAAQLAGVTAPTTEYQGDDPMGFVISLNLHRRHLSESQRSLVAARVANMPLGGAVYRSANLQTEISQAKAAEMLNVSTRLVADAAKVRDEAPAPLVAAVERGDMAVSLAAKVTQLPPEEVEQVALAPAEHMAEIARAVVKAHVANNSGNNEWYTPTALIEAARATMGAIDLDPASCEIANKTVGAGRYFSAESNGLAQPWSGRVWMNPPYAQPLIAEFCEKLVAHCEEGDIRAACVLVNNGTETAWGQQLLGACDAVCFPKSRIRFIDQNGKPSGAPLQGQMIAYFGPDPDRFSDQFGVFGTVLRGAASLG